MVFTKPLELPIKLVYGDTGEPAPKVSVSGVGAFASASETTDEQGRVTLRLPPGRYRMEYLPAKGTPYLVTNDELVVGAKPAVEPVTAKLRAGWCRRCHGCGCRDRCWRR